MVNATEITIMALAIAALVPVITPPLYAWCDRWLDRTRKKEGNE